MKSDIDVQMVEKRQNIYLGQVEGLRMQMDVQSLKILQCVHNSVCKNMHQKESIERITKVKKKKHDTVGVTTHRQETKG